MKILLVEDDQRTADFIVKGLKQEGYKVEHIDNGKVAYDSLQYEHYDAAVMDLMLPGMDGLNIITRLREQGNQLPIIVLSAKREVDDRISGLKRGADDYLVKPFAFSELLVRLQAIMRRHQPLQELRYLNAADLKLDLVGRKVYRNDIQVDLQPREFSLLEYLLRHKGRVVSKIMIMENVWDYNFDPRTNIVESRICRLREKVDKDFDHKLIKTIRGVGYVIED